jgi:hypothetical protein
MRGLIGNFFALWEDLVWKPVTNRRSDASASARSKPVESQRSDRCRFLLNAFTLMLALAGYCAAPAFYNVRDYGAVGDGKTLDSPAINKAIEAAAASGGGTVLIAGRKLDLQGVGPGGV